MIKKISFITNCFNSFLTENINEEYNKKNSNFFLHSVTIVIIFIFFMFKYYLLMFAQNALYHTAEWYQFLEKPSSIAKTGFLDPSLLGVYAKTLSVSLGHQALVQMYRFFGLETGLTIIYSLAALIFVIAVYYFIFINTKSLLLAFIISLICVNSDFLAMSHFGACGHIAQTPARDYMALSLFIIGFNFLLKSRNYLFSFFLILGFFFHMSHGIFAFGILLPVAWYMTRDKKFLISHILCFLTIIIGVYYYLSQFISNTSNINMPLWFKYAYIFNGGHIFFDHSINYYIPTFAFFSILLSGFLYSLYESKYRFFLISIIAVWIFIGLISFLFIHIIPLKIVYSLTPIRSSLIVSFFIQTIVLIFYFKELFFSENIIPRILAGLGIVSYLSGTFLGVFVFSFLLCLIILIKGNRKIRLTGSIIVLIIIGLMISVVQYSYDYNIILNNLIPFMFICLSVFIYIITKSIIPIIQSKNLSYTILIVIISICVFFTHSIYVTGLNPSKSQEVKEFSEIGKIIQEKVPVYEPVLTAPFFVLPIFEVVAKRGSLFQLSKAHMAFIVPALLPVFDSVLKDLNFDISTYKGNWVDLCRDAPVFWRKTMNVEYIMRLKRKYNFHYMLTYADHKIGLKIIYRGNFFILYKI